MNLDKLAESVLQQAESIVEQLTEDDKADFITIVKDGLDELSK